MKANWDEAKGAGTDWLPPFTEWDFRTIKERESRLACCWEYARSTARITDNVTAWIEGAGDATVLGHFMGNEGMRFPEAWVLCGNELRFASELVEPEMPAVTACPFRVFKDYLKLKLEEAKREGRDVSAVVDEALPEDGMLLVCDYERCGTEAVLRRANSLLREEGKNHVRPKRGKGAAPPFEMLKWLAALRLEVARQAAGLSYAEVQAAVCAHEREYPIEEASPTLPVYSGHAAWSKAIGDARRALDQLADKPKAFEKRIGLF